jgi:hypothetical protein
MPLRSSTAARTFSMRVMAARERASEEKIAETVAFAHIAGGAMKDEGARAIAEKAAKFAGDACRGECAAVDIGSDYRDGLCAARNDQRLRDGEGVQKAEAGPADIQRATVFADEQPRMQLRRK